MNLSNQQPRAIDVTPDPAMLQVLSKLEVPPEGCLGELIDNSLDSFRESEIPKGKIEIRIEQDTLNYSDNGSGLNIDQIEQALTAGASSKSKVGELGLFGIGFNLGTSKLGTKTTIFTKRKEDSSWITATIDPLKMSARSKNKRYELQPEYVALDTDLESGLIVRIELRKQYVGKLGRPRSVSNIRAKLGRSYSYVLRTEVPGLPAKFAGDKRDFSLKVNDVAVTPRIPCIWDQDREMANGAKAVQSIDTTLAETLVCQACGYEEPEDHDGPCSECGGDDLILQHRRIWGWIGVQRAIESEEYGIDLIRLGRTIEADSKDFFKFTDPDTQKSELEYPIEQTNAGRIVGEIHCDHVPVEFTKQSFEKINHQFRQVARVVRGETWLRPRYARQATGNINESVMAVVYGGVRRVDPGERNLIPGNGEKAIHQESRNWMKKFHDGIEDFQLDSKWWVACESHDKIKRNANTGDNNPSGEILGPDPFAGSANTNTTKDSAKSKPRTIKEFAEEWRAGATKREDLSKALYLKAIDHKFEISVWETLVEIKLAEDQASRPSFLLTTSGANFEVFVSKRHSLISSYGRTATDIALGEAAHHLANQGSKASFGEVLAELLKSYPDEEKSEAVTRQKCDALKSIFRARLPKLLLKESSKIWSSISNAEREKIALFAVDNTQTDLDLLGEKGEFARYITWSALTEVIQEFPELIFNNKLFTQSLGGEIATEAARRVIDTTSAAIMDLVVFDRVGEGISKFERDRAEISISFIQERLNDS